MMRVLMIATVLMCANAGYAGTADCTMLESKLTSTDGYVGDVFGYSVAIDGDVAVIGAYGDDGYSGSASIYERQAAAPGNRSPNSRRMMGLRTTGSAPPSPPRMGRR